MCAAFIPLNFTFFLLFFWEGAALFKKSEVMGVSQCARF